MQNLSSLVKPKGHLFLSVILDSDFYVTHDKEKNPKKIKITNVGLADIKKALFRNNFDLEKTDIQILRPDDIEEEGLEEIAVVYAQKR
jgi:uncharacterized short protein YbdD (DUF466 family)